MDQALTRRRFLARSGAGAAGAALVSLMPFAPAEAAPDDLARAIKEVVGSARLNTGKVTLDIAPLVENGNTVPMKVMVESPMTAKDHVKAIHVFNEKNPQPYVLNATLGPRAGRAAIATHIKLRESQKIVAVAEFSDGTFWTAGADVIVTIAACVEDLLQ
ncbi:MAG: SoxY-related AACIE arm protein [Alphaproteobacteria bacterium]|nr:SoxY-related AACIE arm protein [Alphaproteobacteria bacterium]